MPICLIANKLTLCFTEKIIKFFISKMVNHIERGTEAPVRKNRFDYLAGNDRGYEDNPEPSKTEQGKINRRRIEEWAEPVDSKDPHRVLRQMLEPRPIEAEDIEAEGNELPAPQSQQIYPEPEKKTYQPDSHGSTRGKPSRSQGRPQPQKVEARRVRREQRGNGIHGIGPRNSGPEYNPGGKPAAKRTRRIYIPKK